MTEIITVNLLVDLLHAGVALITYWWALRWLDRRNGYSFQSMFERIHDDPKALASYLGYRWIGGCLVVASFIVV